MADTRHLVVEFGFYTEVRSRMMRVDGEWIHSILDTVGNWMGLFTPPPTCEQVLEHCKIHYVGANLSAKINGVDYLNLPGQDDTILNA